MGLLGEILLGSGGFRVCRVYWRRDVQKKIVDVTRVLVRVCY